MKLTQFPLIVSLSLICSVAAASQEPPQRPPASDFNIEILNLEGPRYVDSVPGSGAKSGYLATGRLNRIATWKPSEAAPSKTAALKIGYWMDSGGVRVEVIAYLGETDPHPRPADLAKLRTVQVASRVVSENETITISETEAFGIEPIGFRVVKAKPWSIAQPEITNKTQALNIVSIGEERPAYSLNLRNLSPKCITAISWYGLENGKRGGGSGLSGVCLIAAGGTFQMRQHFALNPETVPEDSQQPLTARREIVIAAILFEDGTFEGEADLAAKMAAHRAAEAVQISQVLPLLRDISFSAGEDQSAILAKLKDSVTKLGEDLDPVALEELSSRFCGAGADRRQCKISEDGRSGLRLVKNHLLQEIQRFEYQREHSPESADLGAWVKGMIRTFARMSTSH